MLSETHHPPALLVVHATEPDAPCQLTVCRVPNPFHCARPLNGDQQHICLMQNVNAVARIAPILPQDIDPGPAAAAGASRTWPQSAGALPAADAFDWQGDQPLRLPQEDLVIYEMHVRGFTHAAPDVRAAGGVSLRASLCGPLKWRDMKCSCDGAAAPWMLQCALRM